MTSLYKWSHKSKEECQKQCPNMCSIYIGIGHDNDFLISKAVEIDTIFDSASNGSNKRFYFVVCHHFLHYSLLGIEDFTSQWKDRLKLAITTRFRTSTRRVSLHDEEFCSMLSSLATVGKLTWEYSSSKDIFSKYGFFCKFCSKSCSSRKVDFCENFIKFFWIFCEIVFEIVVSQLFNCSTNIAISESSFGLSFKLRFRDFYRDDSIESIGYI